MVPNRKVWWPVIWQSPVDNGKVVEAKVSMQFVLKGTDELPDLIARANAIDDAEDSRPASARKAALMAELISDWRDIGDEAKKPIPYSEDALAEFFGLPATFMATINAYGACLAGEPVVREKN